MNKINVGRAEMYNDSELGSFGTASGMYIRQFEFPETYDRNSEKFLSLDHDRLLQWDHAHASMCFREYTGTGDVGFATFARQSADKNVMAFIRAVTKADETINWTGYRILASVNRATGYVVWTLQLFAKNPKGSTKVYTGENAPNVRLTGRATWINPYDYER